MVNFDKNETLPWRVLEQDALAQLLRRSDGTLNRGPHRGGLSNLTRATHMHSIHFHVCWVRQQMTYTKTR